jgi:hypothetical protein
MLEQQEQQRVATIEALRAEVKKGLAGGRGKSAEEVLGRLERKYTSLAQVRRGK